MSEDFAKRVPLLKRLSKDTTPQKVHETASKGDVLRVLDECKPGKP